MRTKIIYSNNGTLSDLTPQLNNYSANSTAFSFTASEDALYLGSVHPFTSKYFKISSANVSASTSTVSYWDGNQWRECSSVVDETGLSGTPFANSGYLQFYSDKRYSWLADDTSISGSAHITGLGSLNIYNLYWIKITYSNDIAMTLDWVGDLFCESDTDLGRISPSVTVSQFKDDWESGKTDWLDQRIEATNLLIEELQSINLNSSNLLLDKTELSRAAAYRTLILIYDEMGDTERVDLYNKRLYSLKQQSLSKDKNLNGLVDSDEAGIQISTMVR